MPIDEFRSEFNLLIENRRIIFHTDLQTVFDFFGGPVIPFSGSLYGRTFAVRRNVIWAWRSSKYIDGSFEEEGDATKVEYTLVRDRTWMILMRAVFTLPLVISATTWFGKSLILGFTQLTIAILAYLFIDYIDEWRAKKLELSFQSEMNMLPHNHKSRFKK